MIDIVTVVFRDELPVLQVQAQSIDLFCHNLGIKNIWVIVNDENVVADQIDKVQWGTLQDRVRIIPRNYFGTSWAENGWVSQQVLKMLAASISENVWSMILDAKTLVNNNMHRDMFIIDHERLKLGTSPIEPVFQTSAKIAGNLFGITVDRVAQPSGVPFFFHNESMRQMIECVTELTQTDFASWFQSQGMLTEFILYTAFIKHKHKDLSKVYPGNFSLKLFNNICHTQWQQFDDKLNAAKKHNPLTIGVHRNAWTKLTNQQKQNYIDYLCMRGMTKAKVLL